MIDVDNLGYLEPDDFDEGDLVLYIPTHAKKDPYHPDCDLGIVSSANYSNVFVKFIKYIKHAGWDCTSQGCRPEDLIIIHKFVEK